MERLVNWLKRKIAIWLGLHVIDARLKDVERHFVTKRDASGAVTETLADVPFDQRKERTTKMRGMSIEQRRRWLEETDGGRIV